MDKSLYTTEYDAFLALLRQHRQRAGLTQDGLAQRLGRNQAFVSKIERGERRVDAVELRAICLAMGVSYRDFVVELDDAIAAQT